ncbi:carbon starvation CstA family protein [Archangium sp.]|uniref:carbon starvation CstA family protein n=1 Tax=Archangium sp. TaxID=1872627 RepID=UPI002D530EFB|nr:carbon starvation CstA 5TM domain-containing protein [Archangium sp.]HYO52743.1 carbon starvation CstA 5TM domain-containing protein [Archangium sp.]
MYGAGLGCFLVTLIGEKHLVLATTFGAMAFSTLVFDTLDVSTRLGRYILQELVGARGKLSAFIATVVTCGVPLLFVLMAGSGAWRSFWTLFGTSNHLLASLSLLGICVWLKKSGRGYLWALLPMCLVAAVTVMSLVLLVRDAFFVPQAAVVMRVNGVVASVLLVLEISLFVQGFRVLLERDNKPRPVPVL